MANDAQIDYWNTTAGPEWVRLQDSFDALLAPFGQIALRAAAVVEGQRIIDVGCGCGTTTIELGRRVGRSGRVLGVDVSGPMLEVARRRVGETGLSGFTELVQADAQVHAFEPGAFDAAFSRMGVMFFDDPAAAFANLREAVEVGGRLVFASWQPLAANPWLGVPISAIGQVVALPPPPPPDAPGPFSLSDPERVRAILSAAGWADVQIEPRTERLVLGGDEGVAGAVGHLTQLHLTRTALADVDEMTRTRALAAIRNSLEPHVDARGHVRFDGGIWLVHARRLHG